MVEIRSSLPQSDGEVLEEYPRYILGSVPKKHRAYVEAMLSVLIQCAEQRTYDAFDHWYQNLPGASFSRSSIDNFANDILRATSNRSLPDLSTAERLDVRNITTDTLIELDLPTLPKLDTLIETYEEEVGS